MDTDEFVNLAKTPISAEFSNCVPIGQVSGAPGSNEMELTSGHDVAGSVKCGRKRSSGFGVAGVQLLSSRPMRLSVRDEDDE